MAANRDGLAGSVPDHRNLLRAGCRQCPSLVPQSGSNDAPATERRRSSRLCSGAPRRTFLAPCTAIRGEHRKCLGAAGALGGILVLRRRWLRSADRRVLSLRDVVGSFGWRALLRSNHTGTEEGRNSADAGTSGSRNPAHIG